MHSLQGSQSNRNIKNDDYEKPFVYVAAAYPVATQVNKAVIRVAPALPRAA